MQNNIIEKKPIKNQGKKIRPPKKHLAKNTKVK
jgi:hypothetical protein